MSDTRHEFASAHIRAGVLLQGAELCALDSTTGQNYLWPAGSAWPRHAPNLFPIVGRLQNDTLRHHGKTYHLNQHGFARDLPFTWVDRNQGGCVLALTDTPETLQKYPFNFRFEIAFAASGATLRITYTVTNTGDETLPASMGAHPAFRWPLTPGRPKEDYTLTFDAEETAPLRGVSGGLLTPAARKNPIFDRRLALNEALFANDALILEKPASTSVRFAAETGPAITVAWEGFSQLGIWSRAGGDFLCIEPWEGMASPQGFDAEFSEKPWLMLIPPGISRTASIHITVE